MRVRQKRYFRLLYWLLKIAAPVNVLLFPALAFYGHFNSWAPANEALSRYANETPVMIGAGAGSQYSMVGGVVETSAQSQRSYILVPSVLRDPKVVTVIQDNKGSVQVAESTFAFVFLVIWYGLCLIGTWWFWFRSKRIKRVRVD